VHEPGTKLISPRTIEPWSAVAAAANETWRDLVDLERLYPPDYAPIGRIIDYGIEQMRNQLC
jgi:hypothetical protein